MDRITSRHNAVVARCRAIARGQTGNLLLLDGPHLVAEALAAGMHIEQAIVRSEAAVADQEVRSQVERLERARIPLLVASSRVMDAVSPVHSSSPIVAIARRPAWGEARLFDGARSLVVIASDIQDPGNVGAIVRVAEAGGATGAMFTGGSADPFGWKALRGSMGSMLRVPIARFERTEEAIATAQHRGCRVLAMMPQAARSIFDLDLTAPLAVLIGGEGRGLDESLASRADEVAAVPMAPPVESLNAAVAAALVVYEVRRQRALGSKPQEPQARLRAGGRRSQHRNQ
jgi:RNA methyltransferase, TrmH family